MQRFTLFYILQIWAQRFNVFQDYELNQILTFIKIPQTKNLVTAIESCLIVFL